MSAKRLEVKLYAARNLAVIAPQGFHDPSCSLTVGSTTSALSAPKSSFVKRKAVNPIWNQTLRFDVSDPDKEALLVKFFDTDDLDHQTQIGEVWIPFTDLRMGVESKSWYKLENVSSGEVEVGLIALDFETASSYPPVQPYLNQAASIHLAPSTSVTSQPRPASWESKNYSSAPLSSAPLSSAPLPTPPLTSSSPLNPTPSVTPGLVHAVSAPPLVTPTPVNPHPPPASAPVHNVPNVHNAPNAMPAVSENHGIKRSSTVGPFGSASVMRNYQQHGLIHFAPQDLQREFPHLARGSYGVVFKGYARGLPNVIVIKDMEIQNQRTVDDWRKEITVMSQNRSPYVAEVFGYSMTGNILTIVMEYFPNGDLYTVLHKKPQLHPLSMLQRMRMARHCALGLQHLHKNHFIHRDMKSMNILVTAEYACKLADFGCAKLVSDRQIFNTVNSGTPLWMAPEVKRGQYNLPADVYSLGLVLFEIFERKLPVFDQIRQTVILPPTFQSASVVIPCLNPIPDKRPTAEAVVQVLDKMIRNLVLSVQKLLPQEEQEKIKGEAKEMRPQEGMDHLDAELLHLYNHLLSKPAHEVDALISKAFGVSIETTPSSSPAPQPQAIPQQPPSYQPPHQGFAPYNAQHPQPQAFPPVGIPQGVPASYPQYPAMPHNYQQSFPQYTPGIPQMQQVGIPPSYPSYYPGGQPMARPTAAYPAQPHHAPAPQSSVGNDELTRHLESLTLSELQAVLARHGYDSKYMFSKTDLINKIKACCAPQVMHEMRNRPQPAVSHTPSHSAISSSHSARTQRAKDSFKLYSGDQDELGKEATILCLSDLLRDKMDDETVRSTTDVLFDNYDKQTGCIDLKAFLEIHDRLLEMSR